MVVRALWAFNYQVDTFDDTLNAVFIDTIIHIHVYIPLLVPPVLSLQ
jgi:hypothetical protein